MNLTHEPVFRRMADRTAENTPRWLRPMREWSLEELTSTRAAYLGLLAKYSPDELNHDAAQSVVKAIETELCWRAEEAARG